MPGESYRSRLTSLFVLAFSWGEGEIIYLSLHCQHQNDSCIKTGSDGSHFNVSLIVRDKVTRQCPQTTTFEKKGEPKQIRNEVPLLTSLMPYRHFPQLKSDDYKLTSQSEVSFGCFAKTCHGSSAEKGLDEVVIGT